MTVWNLFLDDLRVPFRGNRLVELARYESSPFPTDISTIKWATGTQAAIGLTVRHGLPAFMYLDHDLGDDDTSMEYLKWIANMHDSRPPDYTIISANPIGAKNIEAFMRSWAKVSS